jgi:hypothetical protein
MGDFVRDCWKTLPQDVTVGFQRDGDCAPGDKDRAAFGPATASGFAEMQLFVNTIARIPVLNVRRRARITIDFG